MINFIRHKLQQQRREKALNAFTLSLAPRRSSLLSCGLMLMLCLSLAMTGCGFHLRGQVELPDSLSSIYIEGGLPSSPLREILRQKLYSSNVNVVSQKADAMAYLIITRDETIRREVSWNNAGQPNEYELNYYLTYKLESSQKEMLVAEQSLKQQSTYPYDSTQILVKEEEERRLKKKMVQAAVNQMLRRISTQMRRQNQAERINSSIDDQPVVTETTP